MCYSGTPALLSIVPICGGLVGAIWTLVLCIVGAAYAHRTDGWRAAVAYFIPVVACCCIFMLLVASLGGIAAMLAAQ